jgi:YHS domain-containing protein
MAMATDPVCGMQVDTTSAQHTAEYDGETYYFCARGCMLDFQDDPAKYLSDDWKPQGMGNHD